MNRTSVFKWCREFKNGRTSVHDDQRSGRPSILTDDIVEKIENALRDDRRLTMDELSAMFPQISRSLLHETITETLGYRKLSARWVPKQLTDQHKLNRVEAGQEFLRRYKLHGDEFFRSIVTGDEAPRSPDPPLNGEETRRWRRDEEEDVKGTEKNGRVDDGGRSTLAISHQTVK
ncbi:SETMR methyltransferase, partial [Pseudoatta argentina]